MAQKRILVTGAAGFIGHWTAIALKNRGDSVIGLDNFNAYYDPALKEDRAQSLKHYEIDIVHGEIGDSALLDQMVAQHSITHIVHLAAQAGVRYSLTNPHVYISTNVDGFVSVLELCRRFPHLCLTYASSSSVYGPYSPIPFSENDRADRQTSLYGVTKRSNELLARNYSDTFGIRTTGLRFFTVYGPWGRPDMAYYHFAKAIAQGEPITLYNSGDMWRDFTYVDDIVAGILAAVDKESHCELFNLGNHRPESVLKLVELLEEGLQKKAVVKLLPMQKGELHKTWADLSHSEKMLGFKPKVTLEEGIKQFVQWFSDYFDHAIRI